ncbi:uncharacterized protein HKW66_Vig0041290 [Vigna angularis]|uniref:Uncharacterized protein n=1 Tax=Phaseolus angularis TaxID=3914 RepID=A0A8T0LB69_PHAAN|nr:uncharacterized protein HKW66_Vig0041290 [Vigna angularis]
MKVGKENNNGSEYKHKNQWGKAPLRLHEPAQPLEMLALFTTSLCQQKMEGTDDVQTKGNQTKEEKFSDLFDFGIDLIDLHSHLVKHERMVHTAETDFPDHVSPTLVDDANNVGVDDVFSLVHDVSDLDDEFHDHIMLFVLPFSSSKYSNKE